MPKDVKTVVEAVKDAVAGAVEEVKAELKALKLTEILPDLIAKLGLPRSLDAILAEFIGADGQYDLRRAFKRILQRRVTAQEGRTGAELLARALVKQIDFHYEAEAGGLASDDRHKIVSELAENIGRQFLIAADVVTRYPQTAHDVNDAKARSDVKGLAAARAARTFLVEDLKKALLNAARAAVGDDTVG